MSLIQEALKRQQEDGETDSDAKKPAPPTQAPAPEEGASKEILPGISATPPPGIAAAPAKPVKQESEETAAPPPPPPPLPEEEKPEPPSSSVPPTQTPILESTEKPNKNKVILLGVLVLLIVFAGFKLLSKPDADDESAPDTAEEPVAEDTTIVTPVEVEPEPPAVEPAVTVTETTEPENVTTPTVTSPAVEAPPEPEAIEWPSLTLTAVMGKGKKGSAMINGDLIGVGDTIEGVEFLAVGKNGIYLKYKGESRFLKRGQTIF